MKYHWSMNCNKCGKLIGHYSIETEYEPDGWSKFESECLECEDKK